MSPDVKICGIACVKDSHRLLEASVKHLALNGIGDFYVYDHGSDPELATDLADGFSSGAVRLHILRKETRPFFQRSMVAALSELARMDGFDVALAFDADEFWCATTEGRTLADQISAEMSADVDALSVPVINYVQHCDTDVFSVDSLSTCRYSVIPHVDDTSDPWDQVGAGWPFVAMPFPFKVVARLSPGIRFTEGQHAITNDQCESQVREAAGIVVRHLSMPSRHEVAVKREHGLRRAAAGFSYRVGWQLRRLAHMTDRELDAYWKNNSWHLSDDRRVLVGTYDRLTEDDALVRIGRELARADGGFRDASRSATEPAAPFDPIESARLERLVDGLVNDLGAAELAHDRRATELEELQTKLDERTAWALELDARLSEREERLIALAKDYDERTAWALRLDSELADRQREIVAIKSSTLWRAARAFGLSPRSSGARES